ncbi:MAG: hypothetical protein LBR15_09025 [Methanobrevibacter sp.]|jgi:hypothetical protein|nr:hypothetical protein [Candidatus Methanovirga australis]
MNKMKGLIIIGLILTSIVGSSFAFNIQSTSNAQLSYDGGVLADLNNTEIVNPSKTGAYFGDIYDTNACDNPVTIYNFSSANNESFLKMLNDSIQKKAENDSKLVDLEFVGFKFNPVNSDYFDVAIDDNNIVKVTQLQDINTDEKVLILQQEIEFRNKTSGDVISAPLFNRLAVKHINSLNSDKKLLNQQPIIFGSTLGDYACTAICAAVGSLGGLVGVAACESACYAVGNLIGVALGTNWCIAIGAASAATAGLVCKDNCPFWGWW